MGTKKIWSIDKNKPLPYRDNTCFGRRTSGGDGEPLNGVGRVCVEIFGTIGVKEVDKNVVFGEVGTREDVIICDGIDKVEVVIVGKNVAYVEVGRREDVAIEGTVETREAEGIIDEETVETRGVEVTKVAGTVETREVKGTIDEVTGVTRGVWISENWEVEASEIGVFVNRI